MSGVDAEDDRLEVPGCGGIMMVLDDDYGDVWEKCGAATAAIRPRGPYPF